MSALRSALLLVAALVCLPAAAQAQDYSFSVPSMQMQVVVRPDASLYIVYDITFANSPGAHPIDVVDIGTPHEAYQLGAVTASIGEDNLTNVRPSEYVDPGFEVHLGRHAIGPGRTGTLHVEFPMPDLVYQDTTNADNASLRITPTWFGEQFVRGTTDLQIAVHLPAGIEPDEALYHDRPFSEKALFGEDQHTVVVWRWPDARLTGPHMVGVSFPKRGMTRVIEMSAWDLLVKWFEEHPGARLVAALIFFVALGILFFRFTGGTGISVFVVLLAGLSFWFYHSAAAQLIAFLPLIALLVLYEWYVRTRRPKYLPAIAEIEGGGIKRGLTAPEAAALLELPLGRVLGLVIFGLLKKGVIRQVQADPLAVEITDAFRAPDAAHASPKQRARFYRRAAAENKTVVHSYEPAFLFLIQANPGKPLNEINFSVPMRELLEHVAARVKGFDLSDTQDYYRSIVNRAMTEAKSIGEIEQREKVIDRNFEWLLMNDSYPDVFTSRGYSYRPVWTRSAVGGAMPAAPSGPATGGTTSFGDVAASFAGWTENTMGSFASAIQPDVLSVAPVKASVIDLSGVDHATGEFFKALGESRGSGGGFGGGGCACAGCACACACAGGGR